MDSTRRAFLRRAMHATAIGSIGSPLLNFPALAADGGDYKALVCVFLLGGMDSHDTLIPADGASYSSYENARQTLLSGYRNVGGGNSGRDRERLLGLNAVNAADHGGRRFALPEDMPGLQTLFNDGGAAIVGNVGPLFQRVTRQQLDAPGVVIPRHLFSHNDQQSMWMSGQPEGARFGWGGRFADALLGEGAGGAGGEDFVAMTGLGNEVFLTGELARPYQFTPSGAPDVRILRRLEEAGGRSGGFARLEALRRHLQADGHTCRGQGPIECDYAAAMGRTLRVNDRYNEALGRAPDLGTPFPGGPLGGQLRAVARTIAARDDLGPRRQVFFVGLGGFDTHSNQVLELPRLQRELDRSIVAFDAAMKELGIGRNVTLFTASDFGRALAVNGDGTDHGWGGHHFVVGGGVRGGRLFGEIPPSELGHDHDAGSGRLIPTTAVDQFAGSLGRWFGVGDDELRRALPRLDAFGGVTPELFG